MNNDRLLTMKDLAEQLHCSRNHAERMVMSGAIASLKIGRSRRITPAAVREFIEQRQRVEMARPKV